MDNMKIIALISEIANKDMSFELKSNYMKLDNIKYFMKN